MKKEKTTLDQEAIKAIEDILQGGNTAEVRLMADGVSVTRIYRKRAYPN